MQINLIPKTKETEERKKQVNFVVFMVAAGILIAVGVITVIVYGINLAKSSKIKSLDKKTDETKKEIANFSDIEENVTYLVQGLEGVKTVVETRKDWTLFLSNLATLMPRDSHVENISLEPGKAIFSIKTVSAQKAAEFMKSISNYEFEKKTTSEETANDNGEESQEGEKQEEETEKIKLFTKVDISKYNRYFEDGGEVLQFDIEAQFTEELWQAK